jgi:hypothetical protein
LFATGIRLDRHGAVIQTELPCRHTIRAAILKTCTEVAYEQYQRWALHPGVARTLLDRFQPDVNVIVHMETGLITPAVLEVAGRLVHAAHSCRRCRNANPRILDQNIQDAAGSNCAKHVDDNAQGAEKTQEDSDGEEGEAEEGVAETADKQVDDPVLKASLYVPPRLKNNPMVKDARPYVRKPTRIHCPLAAVPIPINLNTFARSLPNTTTSDEYFNVPTLEDAIGIQPDFILLNMEFLLRQYSPHSIWFDYGWRLPGDY